MVTHQGQVKQLEDNEEVFIVGDRNQRNRKTHQDKKLLSEEKKKEDLMIDNSEFEVLKNFVGPSYIMGAFYGVASGIFLSTREVTFKNRPKKLIASSVINIVGRQASKFANAAGCLCLLYTLVRKSTNYLFDDDLEDLSISQKQLVYGFLTGFLFKSSRGLYPSLFSGSLMAIFCGSFSKASEKKYFTKVLPF
mmetsp:Transcript_30764/g.31971  ORF Transcript_30764/g.31971 Transcript_30764/m.31971 type:complete len:193 (+) Transcript_30764:13-591(+)